MSDIKPALSESEWAAFLAGRGSPVGWLEGGCDWSRGRSVSDVGDEEYDAVTGRWKTEAAHGAAAMLLYGQSFGFTHEDVEVARYAAMQVSTDHPGNRVATELVSKLRALADRIEALLPPVDLTRMEREG